MLQYKVFQHYQVMENDSLLKSIEAYKKGNVNEIWISVLTNTKLTKVVETRKKRVSVPVQCCQYGGRKTHNFIASNRGRCLGGELSAKSIL